MKKNKKTQKPFADFSASRTFRRMMFIPQNRKELPALVKTVMSNFFIIQQKQKFGITDIPVVQVDHRLDGQIPFVPSKVKIYLDFIWFIARTMDVIFEKIERHTAIAALAEFEKFITELYRQAGTIYSKTLTTTERPKYFSSPRFIIIHAFDPHLLCIPSLHVAIVAGTWAFVRKLLKSTELNQYEIQEFLDEIYFGAIKISESVLYVKQHSINCVTAALYFLTAINEQNFFSEKDAENFIDRLFQDATDIFPSDVQEIHDYMKKMYKALIKDKKKAENWQAPIFSWLNSYSN